MSDIKSIEVPKWGLTMEEGTLSAWLVEEGQAFNKGDELCEIETSKIANVLEATFDGVLRRILVEPGITLPVGALLAIAAPTAVSDAEIDAYLENRQAGQVASAVPESASPVADTPSASEPAPAASAARAEVEIRPVAAKGIPTSSHGEADTSVLATSHAWRLARREGIDLSKVDGSGREGRISVEDVARAVSAAGGSLPPREQSVAAPSVTEQPLSAMRRAIAARLQASKQSAPHYRVSMDLDLEALLMLRDTLNSAVPGLKISVNDMLVKASAQALMTVPELNVQYDEQRQVIRQFADADIAVAVAIDGGLITPIVIAANRKSLGEISKKIHDLAARAKAGTLKPTEFQGGSFSISNLGMHGVRQFDAIINPPQVAILAVGAAAEQVVVRDGQMVIRRQLTVSLSSDHRVVDGALAARFLKELKRRVETPVLLMV